MKHSIYFREVSTLYLSHFQSYSNININRKETDNLNFTIFITFSQSNSQYF